MNHHFTPETSALPVPVDLLVTGSVPAGSGLSSSAAMVVASTLAFLAVNGKLDGSDKEITKGKLVEMSMENEQRVGERFSSGNMIQILKKFLDPRCQQWRVSIFHLTLRYTI